MCYLYKTTRVAQDVSEVVKNRKNELAARKKDILDLASQATPLEEDEKASVLNAHRARIAEIEKVVQRVTITVECAKLEWCHQYMFGMDWLFVCEGLWNVEIGPRVVAEQLKFEPVNQTVEEINMFLS